MNTQWIVDSFEVQLAKIQESLLYLEREQAGIALTHFCQETAEQFNLLLENYKHSQRGDRDYVFKKQCQQILRYLDELQQLNNELPAMNEIAIIKLFEKQYKLKKIVRHLYKRL